MWREHLGAARGISFPGCLTQVLYVHTNLRIRALGGKVNQFPDAATAKKVQVDYTLAAASAFVSSLAPQLPEGKAFRFVFCSGKYAEWDQNRSLAFMGDTRRFKVSGTGLSLPVQWSVGAVTSRVLTSLLPGSRGEGTL